MLQGLEEWVEEIEREMCTLIGRDFNARTGTEGGGWEIGEGTEGNMKEEEERKRKSKNKKINKEGKKLINFLEERGWGILNGCTKGVEKGEYTFTRGKGNTVIVYVLRDEEIRGRIESVGDRVDSDHHSLEVWIKERESRKARKGGRGERE